VWDANYKGVFHLKNGVTLSGADSTGQNSATNITATATPYGQIQSGFGHRLRPHLRFHGAAEHDDAGLRLEHRDGSDVRSSGAKCFR